MNAVCVSLIKTMRKEYDFSSSVRNPNAARLKEQEERRKRHKQSRK